jgi:hypothetical protein
VWSAIGAAALALIALDLLHHAPGVLPRAVAPPSSVAVSPLRPTSAKPTGVPSSHAVPVTVRPTTSPSPAPPMAHPSATPSSPAPGSPSPQPTPSGAGLDVSAALVVPLRGSTPLAVHASIVVPTGPPFPGLDLAVALS